MNKTMKSMIAMACAFALSLSVLAGCSCAGNTSSAASSAAESSKTEESSSAAPVSSVPESSSSQAAESSAEESQIIDLSSAWDLFGTLEIENYAVAEGYEGEQYLSDGSWDITGILAKDSDKGEYFVEFFKDADPDNAILSYWAELDENEDMVTPVIGKKDGWIMNMYLAEDESELLIFSTQTRKVVLYYNYDDGDESGNITITFRLSPILR